MHCKDKLKFTNVNQKKKRKGKVRKNAAKASLQGETIHSNRLIRGQWEPGLRAKIQRKISEFGRQVIVLLFAATQFLIVSL
jgi:hypothetical protein